MICWVTIRTNARGWSLFFQSVTTLQPHISIKLPSISSGQIYCVGFMGNMILWHLLQSGQPISAPSIQTSVPTWRSTCLVSVVSTLSTKCLKLNRAVIHLEVQRSAVCGQLSGGAHSLIVQPSNVPHYVVFYVQHKLEQDMGVDVSLGAFPLVLVH